MVSGLDYGEGGGGGGGGEGEDRGDERGEESWLQFLFKSQINRPPGSRAKASRALASFRHLVTSERVASPRLLFLREPPLPGMWCGRVCVYVAVVCVVRTH